MSNIVTSLDSRPSPMTLKVRIKTWLESYIRATLGEDIMLAEAVAMGQTEFRRVFVKAMGGLFQNNLATCDSLANSTFRFFEAKWRERSPLHSPAQFIDTYAPPSEATQDEIDRAFVVDIGSSDAYMRKHWEGSQRHRTGRIEELGMKQGVPLKG